MATSGTTSPSSSSGMVPVSFSIGKVRGIEALGPSLAHIVADVKGALDKAHAKNKPDPIVNVGTQVHVHTPPSFLLHLPEDEPAAAAAVVGTSTTEEKTQQAGDGQAAVAASGTSDLEGLSGLDSDVVPLRGDGVDCDYKMTQVAFFEKSRDNVHALLNEPLKLTVRTRARTSATRRGRSRERSSAGGKRPGSSAGGTHDRSGSGSRSRRGKDSKTAVEQQADEWHSDVVEVGTVTIDMLPFFECANTIEGWFPIVPTEATNDRSARKAHKAGGGGSKSQSGGGSPTTDTDASGLHNVPTAMLFVSIHLEAELFTEEEMSRGSVLTLGVGDLQHLPASWLTAADLDDATLIGTKKKTRKPGSGSRKSRKKKGDKDALSSPEVPEPDDVSFAFDVSLKLTGNLSLNSRSLSLLLPPIPMGNDGASEAQDVLTGGSGKGSKAQEKKKSASDPRSDTSKSSRIKLKKEAVRMVREKEEADALELLSRRFVAWNDACRFFLTPDAFQSLCASQSPTLDVHISRVRLETRYFEGDVAPVVPYGESHIEEQVEAVSGWRTTRVFTTEVKEEIPANASVRVRDILSADHTHAAGGMRLCADAVSLRYQKDVARSAAAKEIELFEQAQAAERAAEAAASAAAAGRSKTTSKRRRGSVSAASSHRNTKHGTGSVAKTLDDLVSPDAAEDAVVDEWSAAGTLINVYVWLSRPMDVIEPAQLVPRDFIPARVPAHVPWPTPSEEFVAEVKNALRSFGDKFMDMLREGESAAKQHHAHRGRGDSLRDRFYLLLNATGAYREFREKLKPAIAKIYRDIVGEEQHNPAVKEDVDASARSYTLLHAHLADLVNTALNDMVPLTDAAAAVVVKGRNEKNKSFSRGPVPLLKSEIQLFTDEHGRSADHLRSLAIDSELRGHPFAADRYHRARVRLGAKRLEAEDFREVSQAELAQRHSSDPPSIDKKCKAEVASYWYDYALFCFREVGVDMVMREAGGVALRRALEVDDEHIPSLLGYGAFLLERFVIRHNPDKYGSDVDVVHVDAQQALACFMAAARLAPASPLPVGLLGLWFGILGDKGKSERMICRVNKLFAAAQPYSQMCEPLRAPETAAAVGIVPFSPLFDGVKVFSLPSSTSAWSRGSLSARERLAMYLLSVHSSHLAEFILREVIADKCARANFVFSDPSVAGKTPALNVLATWAVSTGVGGGGGDAVEAAPVLLPSSAPAVPSDQSQLPAISEFVSKCSARDEKSGACAVNVLPNSTFGQCFVPLKIESERISKNQREIDILVQCARLECQRHDLACAMTALDAVSAKALDVRQQVDSLAFRGHVKFVEGDMEGALCAYREYLDWNSDTVDPLVLVRAAQLHLRRKSFAEARDVALLLISSMAYANVTMPSAWLVVGVGYLGLVGFDIDSDVSIGCAASPVPSPTLLSGGDEREHLLASAEHALTEANRLDNRSAATWAYLTVLCLLRQRPARADWCYEQARALHLDDHMLHRAIGRLYLERGLVRGAETASKAALHAAATGKTHGEGKKFGSLMSASSDNAAIADRLLASDIAGAVNESSMQIAHLEDAIAEDGGNIRQRTAAEDRLRNVYQRITTVH